MNSKPDRKQGNYVRLHPIRAKKSTKPRHLIEQESMKREKNNSS